VYIFRDDKKSLTIQPPLDATALGQQYWKERNKGNQMAE